MSRAKLNETEIKRLQDHAEESTNSADPKSLSRTDFELLKSIAQSIDDKGIGEFPCRAWQVLALINMVRNHPMKIWQTVLIATLAGLAGAALCIFKSALGF